MKRASTVHELHQSRAALRTCIKRSKSCADLPLLASTPADMGHARLTSFHSREESDAPLGEPPLALAPCRWGGEALSFDSRERRASRRHRRNSGTRISVQFLDSPPTVKARSLDEHPRSELALADGSDVQKADKNFLESLGRDGYAASKQAQAAEDLLQCFKVPNDEAFDDAVASPALQSLDHAVAQVAKALPRPVVVGEVAAPAVAPAPGLTLDDEDELPDLT